MWHTGKWADDPEAFRKMKAALGVQLAQALESSFGLDAEASQDYVDVLTGGFAIRLFLFSNRCAAQAGFSFCPTLVRNFVLYWLEVCMPFSLDSLEHAHQALPCFHN